MKKKACKLILSIALCLLLAASVFAESVGSLLLTDVEHPAVLTSVADEKGKPTADFSGCIKTITEKSLTPKLAKKLLQYAMEKELHGETGQVNEKGEIFFPGLEKGYYLVCSTAEEAEFAPFLISVPMTIGDKQVYNIQAEPKVDSPVEPPEKPSPEKPKPNIPQTGAILWPKYLLLGLGAAAIIAGLVEVLRGREMRHE